MWRPADRSRVISPWRLIPPGVAGWTERNRLADVRLRPVFLLTRSWLPPPPFARARRRTIRSRTSSRLRVLFTTFEGGGHVPPALIMASEMRRRGHDVLFVSDDANRVDAAKHGLVFQSWRHAPNRPRKGASDDPLGDWRRRWPPAIVRAVNSAVICGPAEAYARDTAALVEAFDPDLVVTNELLFGVMAAAEAAERPLAALTANVWPFPDRSDVPPFGPGWRPPTTSFQRRRERTARGWIAAWYDSGLVRLNQARRSLGLAPLPRTLDQLGALDLAIIGTSAAFDFGEDPPRPFLHAGRLLPEPDLRLDPDLSGWITAARRRILVSFSTTYQGQSAVLSRVIRALDGLDARAVVTTGPAVDPEHLPRAANVRAVPHASHDALMPQTDLLVSHGGHGTVIRAMAHGVPALCLPMGRDHPDNARRIVDRGAGLSLGRSCRPSVLRAAVLRLLTDASFEQGAARLAARMSRDPLDRLRAVRALEAAARSGRPLETGPVPVSAT